MKWCHPVQMPVQVLSLPVRGAWVEILSKVMGSSPHVSRSPCGERGLKFDVFCNVNLYLRRSPCGERGLKYLQA